MRDTPCSLGVTIKWHVSASDRDTGGGGMEAQVMAINIGKGGCQMQRWNYIENIFLDKLSWCLLNKYAISRAIGVRNIIVISGTGLPAPPVQNPASGRGPNTSWWKSSAVPPHCCSYQIARAFKILALHFGSWHSPQHGVWCRGCTQKYRVSKWKVGGMHPKPSYSQ